MISFSVRVIFNFFKSRSVSPIPGSTSVKVSRLFRRILLDILCYECTDNTRTIITPSNISIIILQTPDVLDKNDPDELDVWDSQHIALRDFLFELLKLFESLLLVFALFLLLFEVYCSNLLIISMATMNSYLWWPQVVQSRDFPDWRASWKKRSWDDFLRNSQQ